VVCGFPPNTSSSVVKLGLAQKGFFTIAGLLAKQGYATDYIYGPDVAGALIALLDAEAPSHRLYHLGTAAAWALPQWCKLLEKRFPKFRWRESDKDGNVVPLAPGTRTRFSNRRLVEDLGWAPRFDLAAAADDFIEWMQE